MAKAVMDGTLKSVSASQIKEYILCGRKWYFNKILGIAQPERANLALGTAMHAEAEDYFEHGTIPPTDSVRKVVLLPEVPKRGPEILIEQPRNYMMTGLKLAGVQVKGRIDLLRPPVEGQFLVVDWKSTKSWAYCKTADELNRDPQGTIYLAYGMNLWPDAESGLFMHGYMGTEKIRGARARLADPKNREEVEEAFRLLDKPVEGMKEVAKIPSVEEVTPSREACSAFGGCPYLDICPGKKSILDNLFDTEIKGADDMTLKERLAARRATGINPPAATPPEPEPTPEVEEQIQEAADLLMKGDVLLDVKVAPVEPVDVPTTSLNLYVNCAPVGGIVDNLAALINEHTPGILAHLRKTNPESVPTDAVDLREVKFGLGTAALAAFFRKNPPTGNVVATSTGLSAAVVEVLEPIAARVTKAVL